MTIAKRLLLECSPYFVKALEGGFKEAQDNKLSFPGYTLWVVENSAFWLDFGRFGSNADAYCLVELWLFADQHMIPRLQRQILPELWRKLKDHDPLPLDVIVNVYAKTAPGCELRHLLARDRLCFWESNGHRGIFQAVGRLPTEMLEDLQAEEDEVRSLKNLHEQSLRERCGWLMGVKAKVSEDAKAEASEIPAFNEEA